MAVGVKGQYQFQFSIGNEVDFISEENFSSFSLVEEAGNVLPTFQLQFNLSDEKVFKLLHERNDIKISFGKDQNDLIEIPLRITRLERNNSGVGLINIATVGVYSALPYINDSNIFISDDKSGVEVIKDIASKSFFTGSIGGEANFNIDTSLDSQRWIQPNITDKAFINDLWLHSDVGDSFIAVGISSDGSFILKDIKKALGTNTETSFKWRLTQSPETPKDIIFDTDYAHIINSGFINSWLGYGREKLVYQLEDGTEQNITETVDPIIAQTPNLARASNVASKFAGAGMQNGNTHANYYQAYQRNLVHLAQFGANKIVVSFQNEFKPVRVLDLVMFRDVDPGAGNTFQSSENHSGIYVVSKVARTVEHRQFVTVLELVRESVNEVRDR